MRTDHIMALWALAGIAIGGAAIQGLHAQAKPLAYVINEVEVTDQAGFQNYADKNAALIQKHGGKFIIRGAKAASLDGDPPKARTTVYVFDNVDKMQAWRDSAEYKELKVLRDKSAKFRAYVAEGVTN